MLRTRNWKRTQLMRV